MNNATNTTAVHTDPGRDPVTSGHAGSGFGNKVKGVFEVIHGAGENLRGTALGAVDSMGREGPTKNDEIARQGRLEMERGLANLKGSKAVSHTGYGTAGNTGTHAATGTGASATTGAYGTQTHPTTTSTTDGYTGGASSHGIGQTDTGLGHNTDTTTHYPSHHRDDAVAAIPTPELRDAQAQYHNQQDQRPGGALGTDTGTYPQSTKTTAAYDQHQPTAVTGVGGGVDQFGKEAGYSAGGNVRSTGAPGMLN